MINFETDINDPFFLEPVQHIQEHLNYLGAKHFIFEADNVHRMGNMEFAVVGGGKDRSTEAAILMPAPFGNGIWPHIVARGEALAYQAAQEDIRDRNGNILPVIIPAAPCMTSSYDLEARDVADIALGNFYPIAAQHVNLMATLGYGQLRGVVGYSFPAVTAQPTVKLAKWDLDVKGNVVIGEPPHAAARSLVRIGAGFIREGMAFSKQVKAENIHVINQLFDSKQAARQFNKGVIKNAALYTAIVRGMSQGRLSADLEALVKSGIDVTLLHASNSKVTPRKDAIRAFQDASSFIWADTWNMNRTGFLNRQEVTGTNHALADRVGRFAVLAARSLL